MTSFDSQTLSSRCIPYDFDQIQMENFSVKHIMMLSRAVSAESWKPAIEALDDVLDVDVYSLTDGDFFQLLAYQRMRAYTQSPLTASWTCTGTLFVENNGLEREFTSKQIRAIVSDFDEASEEERQNLTDPEQLFVTEVPCSHKNEVSLDYNHLEVLYLTQHSELDPRLDYPRIDTYIDSLLKTEDQEIAEVARWIRAGTTLEEKITVLEEQPDLELFELALKASYSGRHGLSSLIHLECERCNTLSQHVFDITPRTFFDV